MAYDGVPSYYFLMSAIQEPKDDKEEAEEVLAPTWIIAKNASIAKVKAIHLIKGDFEADRTHFNYLGLAVAI